MAASSSMISIFDIFIFLIGLEHQIIFIAKFNFLTGFSSPDYNGNPLLRRSSRAGKIEMKSGKQLLKNTLEQHFINYFTTSSIDTTLSMLVFYHTLKFRFGKFYQQTKLRIKKKQKVTLLIWLFATKVRQREFS